MTLNFRNYSRLFACIRGWFVFAAGSLVLAGSAVAASSIKNVVLVHWK